MPSETTSLPFQMGSLIGTIAIPSCPSSVLSSNNRSRRGHQVGKALSKDTEIFKKEANAEALNQWGYLPTSQPLDVLVLLVWPRRMILPDIDALASYCKPHLDGFNGVVWEDDSQIRRIMYEQRYVEPGEDLPHGCTVFQVHSHIPIPRKVTAYEQA
jgi:Holliday junction resolvase RusA-like endonuclease